MSEAMDAGDLWAFLNCGDIDDCDEQAECFLKSTLDGVLAHPEEHHYFVKRGLSQMLQATKARFKREAALAAPSPAPAAISVSDHAVIIAGIRQFGLAPDGSDLRDLEAAIARLSAAQPRSPEGERTQKDRGRTELDDWKQAAQVEAGLRREFQGEVERLQEALRKAKRYIIAASPTPDNLGAGTLQGIATIDAALAASPEPSHTVPSSRRHQQDDGTAEPGAGGEWQPIETAPKGEHGTGPRILLWDTFSVFEGFWNGGAFVTAERLQARPHVNHWRPLPAPPLAAAPQQGGDNAG